MKRNSKQRPKKVVIKRAGKSLELTTHIHHNPEIPEFEIRIMTKNNKRIGRFITSKLVGQEWNILHRWIKDHPEKRYSFRHSGLGSKILKIIEEEVRKAGGDKLQISVSETDVLRFALENGFVLNNESKLVLKKTLGLKKTDQLPLREKVIEILKAGQIPYVAGFVTLFKQL